MTAAGWELGISGDGTKPELLYHYYHYCEFLRSIINQSINETIDLFWFCSRRVGEGGRVYDNKVAPLAMEMSNHLIQPRPNEMELRERYFAAAAVQIFKFFPILFTALLYSVHVHYPALLWTMV